jgi:hypothetical protein
MATNFDEYFPFDSGSGSGSAESRWAVMARFWRQTGVIPKRELTDLGVTNEMEVYADSSGMQVKVKTGLIFIQGFVGRINTQKTITISTAHGSLTRIDTVVARLSRSTNIVSLDVLTGTPAGEPVPETLTQNSTTWEEALAYVTVTNSVSTIAAGKVESQRKMSAYHGGLPTIETSSNVTADVNQSVFTTHDSTQVVVTLPDSASLGDEIFVYSEGDAGWALRSNANVNSQQLVSSVGEGIVSDNGATDLSTVAEKKGAIRLVCVQAGNDQIWFVLSIGIAEMEYDGNYYGTGADGDVTISEDTDLTSTADGDMVVKNYNTLTIDSGKTLTVANRCKGLLMYVKGDCTINGTLTMNARGANVNPVVANVNITGIRLPMTKTGSIETLSAADFAGCGSAAIAAVANHLGITGSGKIYTIERAGGAGGASVSSETNGNVGGGGDGKTGGGGSGGAYVGTSGAGSAGTCFSGGSAGGGAGDGTAGSGIANGGAGGDGDCDGEYPGGGGAGNPGGSGASCQGNGDAGGTGTGGTLILIVGGTLTVGGAGVISSNGSAGGGTGGQPNGSGGGGSGGGIVLALHKGTYSNEGTVQANGGGGGNGGSDNGGAGGAGWVCVEQVD